MRNPKSGVRPIRPCTPVGSRIKDVFEPRFNGHKIVLDKVGEMDIQEKIEAFAPFSDLNYMLHRLKVGDRSVISVNPPLYGDFSGLASNPIDVINIVHNAEERFGRFTLEEQSRYNNDWRVWLNELFTANKVENDTNSVTGSSDRRDNDEK